AIACLSFYPTKNLGAFGEAGMCVTGDPDWAAKMACLRVHGMEPRYHHKLMGWNARLDAIQAALLRVKLPHLAGWTRARQAAGRRPDRGAAPEPVPAAADHPAGAEARVEPVRGPRGRRPARRAGEAPEGQRRRVRGLLPGAAAPAGVPGAPGLRARRLPGQRG